MSIKRRIWALPIVATVIFGGYRSQRVFLHDSDQFDQDYGKNRLSGFG